MEKAGKVTDRERDYTVDCDSYGFSREYDRILSNSEGFPCMRCALIQCVCIKSILHRFLHFLRPFRLARLLLPGPLFLPAFFFYFFLTRTEKQRWCCCILWLLSSITTKILFSFSLSLAPPFLLLFSSLNVKNKKDKKNRRDLNQGHSVPQYERMPIRFKRNNSGKENKL